MTEIPTFPAPLDEAVVAQQDDAALHVRLSPTQQGDVLGTAALDGLLAVLDGLQERPDIRVLVLSSEGTDFCLGADRTEYESALDADATGAAMRRIVDKAHRVCQALETTHVVSIARLHGRVVGAGLALAAFCDLRVGAENCRFRMPEVGLGLPPAWGGAMGRLISEAGAARIREAMLTCEPFDAPTAHRLGLLHKLAPLDELDEAVARLTRPLLRRSPEALTLTRRMLAGYSRADRSADVSLLDAHLLTGQLSRGE
ncbi:enoyl-CoA hydratase/isomerase family protein [Streptomyces sulphureus]|uniref:enoyl-CoA hydratase/isomerase family protein n=1 Tax=Streptomyces sulphureus TaxID=47758 RepID=UPI000477C932|nr:enoyl-CoA hydratase/isomerase family protein [Streptomyces sulphureus]